MKKTLAGTTTAVLIAIFSQTSAGGEPACNADDTPLYRDAPTEIGISIHNTRNAPVRGYVEVFAQFAKEGRNHTLFETAVLVGPNAQDGQVIGTLSGATDLEKGPYTVSARMESDEQGAESLIFGTRNFCVTDYDSSSGL